jgi:type IV secretory pathway VirB2 component (pilin)
VSGGLLVFGAELSDFARRITWMTLAVSLMVAQKSFLNLFGSHISLTALLF